MKKILTSFIACCITLSTASTSFAQNTSLPSFADLVEKLSPSVVNISTQQKPTALEAGDIVSLKNLPGKGDAVTPLEQEHYALGSGFILDENGYILTNKHVIEHASDVTVILSDNSQYPAEIIGVDDKTDIALIKIKPNKSLLPVTLGDSDNIRVGDWILAIGNPFGLGGSVTAGIISAKSRDIESGPYDNYIQTDASINQGSSGGPMFNLSGDVIGINTAIFSTTGGSMGIGFAIPINNAKFVINELKHNGTVNRGWIGIRVQPQLTVPGDNNAIPTGILISSVIENSPAAETNAQAGDIILTLNGQEIPNAQTFSRLISESPVGNSVALKIWRDGSEYNLMIKVKEMPNGTNENDVVEAVQPQTAVAPQEEQSLGDILNDAVNPQTPASETPAPATTSTPEPTLTQPLPTTTQAETKSEEEIAPDIAPADANNKSAYTIPGSGLMVRNIALEDIQEMNLKPDTMGVIVMSTLPNSEAAVKGIRPGVIITQINNRSIYTIDSAKYAIYDQKDKNEHTFLVQDGENINTVTLRMSVK